MVVAAEQGCWHVRLLHWCQQVPRNLGAAAAPQAVVEIELVSYGTSVSLTPAESSDQSIMLALYIA